MNVSEKKQRQPAAASGKQVTPGLCLNLSGNARTADEELPPWFWLIEKRRLTLGVIREGYRQILLCLLQPPQEQRVKEGAGLHRDAGAGGTACLPVRSRAQQH